jgi:hypothetical protein
MLDRMDTTSSYSCGRYGHSASRCPGKPDAMAQKAPSQGGWKGAMSPKKSTRPTYRPSATYKPIHKPKPSSNAMQQLGDSDYEEEHRHEPVHHHEPVPLLYTVHTSPDGYVEDLEDEYESDYESPISFNSMAMNADDEFDDDDAGELKADETLDELYKLSSEGLETRAPKSIILPTYDAEVGGTIRKMHIDTGASTVYSSKRLADELDLKMTKIKARRVKVADNDRKIVDRITTVDIKLGNLPAETITAYVFPLKEIDLVLGLLSQNL